MAVPSHTDGNVSFTLSDYDTLLPLCWSHQSCSSCLGVKYTMASSPTSTTTTVTSGYLTERHIPRHPCVFCPHSGTCIPNLSRPQLLSPIWKKDGCPGNKERFEMRTSVLGCGVSTVTFVSVWISILATLTVAVLFWLTTVVLRRTKEQWRQRDRTVSWLSKFSRAWPKNGLTFFPRRSKAIRRSSIPSERSSLLGNETVP